MVAIDEPGTSATGTALPFDLLIAGDSHVVALGVPHTTEAPAEFVLLEPGPPRIFTITEKWTGSRGAEYWDLAARHGSGRTVALSWNGNQHNASFLIAPAPLFDFICPGAAATVIHEGAVVLPAGVVRAYFQHTVWALDRTIRLFRSHGARRILVLGTPAPKRDGDFILDHIRSEEYFQNAAAAAGIDLGAISITPAPIRQKLWALIQRMMADIAAREGAVFVPVPPDTLEADGTLKRQDLAGRHHPRQPRLWRVRPPGPRADRPGRCRLGWIIPTKAQRTARFGRVPWRRTTRPPRWPTPWRRC